MGLSQSIINVLKRLKVKEGDLFAVPLGLGGFGIGLVAREHRKITLGYFFKQKFSSLPVEININDIDKWDVALIGKFSSMGIELGEWPILTRIENFKRNEWPIPVLKTENLLTGNFFAVIYDDTLLNDERHRISEEEAKELFSDGLYGYGALENKLTSILAETPD